MAKLQINGKNKYVGQFNSIKEAKEAVEAAREELHGEFANHG